MNKLQNSVEEGWSVLVYDKQRRLLCALEASHGWMFLLGCVLGIALTVFWVNVAQPNSETGPFRDSSTKSPVFQID